MGTQTLTVAATGSSTNLQLPIAVTLAKDLPAKLTVTPQLPELRGTSKSSFEYQLSIKNDSGKKLTVSLSAQAPQNFDTSFTEQYGTQELNAVPIDAGQTKDVKLKVTPPNTAAAGDYKVTRAGRGGGRFGDDRSRPRHHRPAEARRQRPRRSGVDARLGRQGDVGAGGHHQYRHGAGRRRRAVAARRRAAGRSPSIRRRSIASRRTTTRKCRR